MRLKTIKALSPRNVRVDEYEPKDDTERRRRVEAHRRRIQRELRRQQR